MSVWRVGLGGVFLCCLLMCGALCCVAEEWSVSCGVGVAWLCCLDGEVEVPVRL